MISLPNPTAETFAEYVATQDARNNIQLKVHEYCLMLCDALEQNYIEESIKRHKFFAKTDNAAYHEQAIENIKNGEHYKFYIESGRKYHKIWMETDSKSRSVHAFIDKKTGELYKPASVKAPAKGVRYDLRLIKDREYVLENCDWSGGYLYHKG